MSLQIFTKLENLVFTMVSYLEKGMEVVSTMVGMATGETIGVIGWSGIFHQTPRHRVLLLKKDDTHVATPSSPANTTEEAWNLSDVIVFSQVLMYLLEVVTGCQHQHLPSLVGILFRN